MTNLKAFRLVCCLLAACFLSPLNLQAHDQGPTHSRGPASEMADAASHFLATLSAEQKAKATFEFQADERLNWHFIPRPRKGLPLKEMTAVQQRLAHVLLSSGLSQRGYAKAVTIMTLEQILREIEKGSTGMVRDEELYFVSIFGNPGPTQPWGWRVEGHHLSLNFTIEGGSVAVGAPSFMGTNPGEVLEGPRKGLRVLGHEEDLGRELITSMSAEQQKLAVISNTAPKDIITAADRKVKPLEEAGISWSKLNRTQRGLLRTLVEEYARRVRPELADADLAKIEKQGWNKLRFAWAGGFKKFEGHYYRIQGPTFLIEYDNVQNNNNHVHAVWRDFANDFGEDILKRHHLESHHH
ncbi:MAG: DUF3500 domain-containing protein [Verrucomicrobia bacterium]|nr:DUF3500 domain-containing protein [Verrucomicrobiota bacterium]